MVFEALLEHTERIAQIGSWEWDLVTGAGACSKGFFDIHGMEDPGAMSLSLLWPLGYAADMPGVERAFNDALAGRCPWDVEHRIIRQNDGAIRYIRSWGEIERNDQGEPVRMYGVTQDITDRKQAERVQSQLAAIVENSEAAIIGTEFDSTVISWNHGAERLYGYTEVEAIGRTIESLIAPDQPGEIAPILEQVQYGKVVTNLQTKRRTKDGRVIDVVVTISPVRDETGVVIGASSVAHDISRMKQLEAALREHELRLSALIDAIDERIWAVDTEYRLIVCNDQFHEGTAAAFGRSYEIGECLLDERVEAASRLRWKENYDRALRGEYFRIETQGYYKSSVFEYFFNPIIDDLGVVTGVAVHGRDITARKQAEEAQRINLTKYLTLFETVPVGITVTDDRGRILETNSASQRILGVPKSEHEQRTFDGPEWTMIRPDGSSMPGEEYASVRALTEQRLVENVEAGMVAGPDCTVWISINAAPIPLPGYGVVVAFSDITARKNMEAELRNLNGQLAHRVAERTVQLEAALAEVRQASELKDAFLSSVSHELRTPLTGVIGLADILEMQANGELNERQLHYVQEIRNSGERLNTMITHILDYTALLAGRVVLRPHRCRLNELAAGALHTVQHQAIVRRMKLKLSATPHDVEIVSDSACISQVLERLLDNAVKFTPDGGAIGVEIILDMVAHLVRVTVWDTGIGIAPEHQEAIFRPFEQVDRGLDRQYGGTGLGLPYVLQMVKVLGGSIAVQSVLGEGSRFTVTLPVTYSK